MTAFRRLRHIRHSLRPSDADDVVAMEFDRQLDAWVTGTPAPEPNAASTERERDRLDRLMRAFQEASTLATADALDERLESSTGPATTKKDIWEDIMSATSPVMPSPSLSEGAFDNATRMRTLGKGAPSRKRSAPSHTWLPRLSPVLNAAMVAIMLLTLGFGAFVATGGSDRWGIGGNGNDPGPGVNGLASLPAGLQGTPAASTDLPTASECTVTPLTVDQVMDRIKGSTSYASVEMATTTAEESADVTPTPALSQEEVVPNVVGETPASMATPVPTGPQRPSQEMLAEITEAHRQFVACVLKGDQFQIWALIDPESVYWRNFLNTYPPFTDEATVRADLETLADGSAGLDSFIPNISNMLVIDRYLPTVNPDPEASLLKYDLQTENGTLRVVIVGMIYHYPDGTERAVPREEMATNWVYTWNPETESWMVSVIGVDVGRG